MATRRSAAAAGNGTHSSARSTPHALKRRGILAAAGAAVAGIVAKQVNQPVAANNGNFLQIGFIGGNPPAATNNIATSPTQLTWQGGEVTSGAALRVDDTIDAGPVGESAMIMGRSTAGSSLFGVYGEAFAVGVYGNCPGGIGVLGKSMIGTGVFGQSINSGDGVKGIGGGVNSGVVGSGGGTGGVGVIGFGAVAGSAPPGAGVVGAAGGATIPPAGANVGVYGSGGASTGVFGTSTSGYGMYGASTNGIGTRGDTSASGSFGVLGVTTATNSIALGGITNADNSSCFSGGTTNPNAFAAFFQGHVQVTQGAFDVIPMGNKHGLAEHPDGTYRTFYSVESPECWVEDFGEGTLAAGKASIALDADFATLVHTDHYHVFLTDHDGHHHPAVTKRTATGFTVEADADLATVKGKKTADLNGTFSWRVVARPKTTAKVDRLAKATVGHFPLPDVSKLPKSPPPAAKKP